MNMYLNWFCQKNGLSVSRGLSRQKGFTLLETIVLAVFGATLAGVAFAGWNSGRDRLALDNAASDLSGILQAARFQAIRSNQPVAVYLANPATIVTEFDGCNGTPGNIINQVELDDSDLLNGLTVTWNNTGGVVWQTNGLASSCGGGLANQTISLAFNSNTEQITIQGTAGRVQKQ